MVFARSDFGFVHGFDHTHRRRRFCVLVTRFLRTSIGCGRRAPAMCSVLSPMIAAIRALNSSELSTTRFITALLARFFWRERSDDFLKARIAAGRIPGGQQFQGAVTQRERTDRRTQSSFQLPQKLTPSHPPNQSATALGDGDFVNCTALARQRSHRSSLRADKFLEARIVANGIESRIDPEHSGCERKRIRHAQHVL